MTPAHSYFEVAAVLAACETYTDEAQKKYTSSDFLCRIMVAFLLLCILFFIEYSSQNSPKVDPKTIKKGTQITPQTPPGSHWASPGDRPCFETPSRVDMLRQAVQVCSFV